MLKQLKAMWRVASWWEKVSIVCIVVYIISPIDILPEAVFGVFGFADDAGAIVLLVKLLRQVYQRSKINHSSYSSP